MKKVGISMDAEIIHQDIMNYLDVNKLFDELGNKGITHYEFTNFLYGSFGEDLVRYSYMLKEIGKRATVSLHFSPFARLVYGGEKETWKWKSRLKNMLYLAYQTKAQWVNIHMGEGYNECYVVDFANVLFGILEECSQDGFTIPITVENSFQGVFQRRREYGVDAQQFELFFKTIKLRNKKMERAFDIGMIIDLAHLNITGESLDSYRSYFNLIRAWHLSDNYGKTDKGDIRDPHRIIGNGSIDWEHFSSVADLLNACLIIENKNLEDSMQSLQYLKKLKNLFRI